MLVKVLGTICKFYYCLLIRCRLSPHPPLSLSLAFSFSLYLCAALRHEEVPVECKSWTAPCLSRSSALGDAMPIGCGLCQIGEWHFGVPHLGAHCECGSHGYAKEQTAARWVTSVSLCACKCVCVFILEMGALWGCHGCQENKRTINRDVLHEFCLK